MSIGKKEYLDMLFKAAEDGTFPSYNRKGGTCEYRSIDGKHRCAVGILISENDFEDFKFSNIGPVSDLPDKLLEKIIPEDLTLEDLEFIQDNHDHIASRTWDSETFKKRLLTIECFKEYA